MRSDYPSGLGVGQEAGGRRFDSRRPQTTFSGPLGNEFVCIFTYVGAGSLLVGLGSLLVGSGSLFGRIWDVWGGVWEWPGDVFGWVWDGLGKNVRRGQKIEIFKNGWEYVC